MRGTVGRKRRWSRATMLVLPRRSAKMRRRRRRRIQVEAATYYLSLGSYYYVLPPSPVRHAYEPVLCIISFPWSMHVCHLNTSPQYTHNIHAPNHRTCKKHRLETTHLADSSSRSVPLRFFFLKKTCLVDSHHRDESAGRLSSSAFHSR